MGAGHNAWHEMFAAIIGIAAFRRPTGSFSHAADLSAALFAPGWVYENLNKGDLDKHQETFWGMLRRSFIYLPVC